MSTHGLSPEELAGLGTEERAAVEAEYSDEEKKLLNLNAEGDGEAKPAAETKPAEGEAKPAAAATPEGEKKPEGEGAEPKPAEGATDATATPGEAEAGTRDPFAVPFHHTASIKPEDVDARMTSLQKQYDDGAIDLATFLKHRDAVTAAVVTDQVQAKISESSKDQVAQALWFRAVDDFLDGHGAYKDPILRNALDAQVKVLAHDEKNDGLSDRQLLLKAHDDIKARMRVEDPKAPPVDPKRALEDKRKPNTAGVPVTLGGLPAAAENAAADDEFAEIDRVLERGDSASYEQALAKLSKDQQERYLRGVSA